MSAESRIDEDNDVVVAGFQPALQGGEAGWKPATTGTLPRAVARDSHGPVVVIGTSSGLKDPVATATALPAAPTIPVDLHALADALMSATACGSMI